MVIKDATITNCDLPITNYHLPITHYFAGSPSINTLAAAMGASSMLVVAVKDTTPCGATGATSAAIPSATPTSRPPLSYRPMMSRTFVIGCGSLLRSQPSMRSGEYTALFHALML